MKREPELDVAAPEPAGGAAMRRHAKLALGVALVLVLALLAAIFSRHGAFSQSETLYFSTESASGLTPGTAVKLNGMRIGAVSALQLEPDRSVKVTLKIPHEDFLRLRKDAKAALRKEDLVQPATLEIIPGTDTEALSAADPRIAFDRGRSLGQSAQDLTDRMAPILADIKALTGALNDRDHGLGPLLVEWRSASRDLAVAATEIRALAAESRGRLSKIGAQAQDTLGDASAAFTRLDRAAGKAEQSLGRLDDALPGLMKRVDGTLDSVQAVAADAHAISKAAAQTVPRALQDIQPAIEDARDIIRGVKQSWPVRDMVAAPAPAALPVDSYDATVPRALPAR